MGCGLGFHFFFFFFKFKFKRFERFLVMVAGWFRLLYDLILRQMGYCGLMGNTTKIFFFFLADGGRVAEHSNLGFYRWFCDGWTRKIRDFFFWLKLDLFCSDSKINA